MLSINTCLLAISCDVEAIRIFIASRHKYVKQGGIWKVKKTGISDLQTEARNMFTLTADDIKNMMVRVKFLHECTYVSLFIS